MTSVGRNRRTGVVGRDAGTLWADQEIGAAHQQQGELKDVQVVTNSAFKAHVAGTVAAPREAGDLR